MITKILSAAVLAIAASACAHASTSTTPALSGLSRAGQAAQPSSWQAADAPVLARSGQQAGQAAQPSSWTPRQSTPHVYANAGIPHGQAAQPGWAVRQ